MHESETRIPDARHEQTDIGEGFIWGAVGVSLGTLILCALIVLWLYPQSSLDRTLVLPLPVYPEPRLQPSPAADWQQFHAEEMRTLNSTGWVDKSHGVVHIPIAEAMAIVARDDAGGWPTASPAPP